jgi:gliding motility-associated-like protein
MNLNYYRALIILLPFWVLFSLQLFGANPAGGSIQYTYVGPGATAGTHRYFIEAHIFQDCQRLSQRSLTQRLNATCSSSGTQFFNLTYAAFVAPTPAPYQGPYSPIVLYRNNMEGEEVSDLCDSVLNPNTSLNSSCRNRASSVPGYIKFVYSGIIQLSSCNFWTLGLNAGCCRGAGVNTGGSTIYLETRLNTRDFPTNSSPLFSRKVKPFPSSCLNQKTDYGVGAVDPEGDSLVYVLACSHSGASTCVTYKSGFSYSAPIPGFKLDSITGRMTFTSKVSGKYVVSYWAKEYERCTGKWKGQTLRDITFIVNYCSNKVPVEVSGVANVQGKNVKKINSHTVQVCNGETFSFSDTIKDPDSNDTLIFKSNYNDALPGANMSINSISRNLAVVTFTWRANLGNNPLRTFFLEFNDDRCIYPGHGLTIFTIEIVNSTAAGPDKIVCKGDTAFITASGGKLYKWRSLSGDSLVWSGPGKNIWGDTNAVDTNKSIKFLPKKTTYLEVWSDLNEGCRQAQACKDRDTMKVVAAANFSLNMSSDTLICFHDSSIQIGAFPDSTQFSYSYQWSPSDKLNVDTIQTPLATPIFDQTYYVTVVSDSGCIKSDSTRVRVSTPMPDSLLATLPKKSLCPGEKAAIDLKLGVPPGSCGKATSNCAGTLNYVFSNSTSNTNGSGNTGVSNWPCPYGAQATSRQQYLIRASELRNMGMRAGIIEGLGFNVVTLNSVKSLKKYTIKMRCVPISVNSLNSWVINSLVTVFNSKTISITQGWNYHNFDAGYNYDGTSNLLVEVCWENGNAPGSSNNEVAYTVTPFNSCFVNYASTGSVCGSQSAIAASRTNRPNFAFTFCGARDSSEFTYKWTPASGLNYDTIYSPTVSINQKTRFKVVLTDTFNVCSDSTFIDVDVTSMKAGPDTAICPGDTISLKAKVESSCATKGQFVWSPGHLLSDSTVAEPKTWVTQTTQFVVKYIDPCGCKLSDTLTVFADSLRPQAIATNPNCSNNSGQYLIKPGGGIGPWNFSIDSGKTYQSDSIFKNISPGYYIIKVRDSIGCNSHLVYDTLRNSGAPEIDSAQVINLSCFGAFDGEIKIFASNITAGSTYSIDSGRTWSNNLVFKSLASGNYTLFARGATGCLSLPKQVTLVEPPEISLDLQTYVDSCFNQGHGWAIGKAYGGTGSISLSWKGSKAGASHAPLVISDTIYSKLFAFKQYKFEATDSLGCKADSTFEIQEIPHITIDSISAKQTTCFGYDDGEVFVQVSGGNSPSRGISYLFSADTSSRYVIPTYAARPNEAILNKKFNGFKFKVGNHTIKIKDSKGCYTDTTIKVKEPPKVELWANNDSHKICVSNCVKLEVFSKGGNNPNHTYHWTPTVSNTNVAKVCPEGDITYTVYCTDSNGCSSNHQLMKVEFFDSLRVDAGNDTAICSGDLAALLATPKGGKGGGYNYLWSPFNDLTSAFVANPKAVPPQKVTYSVKLTDECGSYPAEDSVTISVLSLPEANFKADITEGCPPLEVTFSNLSQKASSCLWEFENAKGVGTCNTVTYQFLESGKQDVGLVVTSPDGCKHQIRKEDLITVFKTPIAEFSHAPIDATILNPEIEFYDQSEGRINQWHWNFAGMDTSQDRNPTYRFPDDKAGQYLVRLDVITDQGCKHDIIREITIDAGFYIYIPAAFSPNNDGINDVWKPVVTGLDYDFYQVMVFDRWGKLLYDSKNSEEAWDGFHQGHPLANGVYTYQLVVGDAKEEKDRHHRQGSVTIAR